MFTYIHFLNNIINLFIFYNFKHQQKSNKVVQPFYLEPIVQAYFSLN